MPVGIFLSIGQTGFQELRRSNLRALLVDNDPASRINAKIFLQGVGRCDEADDRDSALARFQAAIESETPYQLILVDIQTTDIDTEAGTILVAFREIEARHEVPADRQACIFVTTALSGRQLRTDCLMNGCAEFIAKPLNKDLLFSKLKIYGLIAREAGAADDIDGTGGIDPSTILNTISRKLKKGDFTLPPAPKIALRLRQLIDCDADSKDLVELLKQDLSLASKLISVSNSVYYRGIQKNTTISQALHRLGFDRTREVVMSICCRGYFTTSHPAYKEIVETLWWHSLACAHATEMMIDKLGWHTGEDIFSVGLLHDIGKLLFIQVAGDMQRRKGGPFDADPSDLQALMDEHHEHLGANILDKLGYPDTFVSLIRQHHHMGDPETSSRELKLLQLSDLLAKSAGFGLAAVRTDRIDDDFDALGIRAQLKDEVVSEIIRRMEQLRYVFG
jgi:putative nucleotidyltransferase with HDIG domain